MDGCPIVCTKGEKGNGREADPGNGREEIWCTMRSGAGAEAGEINLYSMAGLLDMEGA